jgi:hypothetical protein
LVEGAEEGNRRVRGTKKGTEKANEITYDDSEAPGDGLVITI